MATEAHMATWEKDANDRTTAALAVLTERFGIELPERPFERLDARMTQIRMIERHADVLDAIVIATGGTPADDLAAMKRPDLNAYAEQRGVENPAGYPNKDALVAAIQEQEQAMNDDPKTPPTGDEPDPAGDAAEQPQPANPEPTNEPPAPTADDDAG